MESRELLDWIIDVREDTQTATPLESSAEDWWGSKLAEIEAPRIMHYDALRMAA